MSSTSVHYDSPMSIASTKVSMQDRARRSRLVNRDPPRFAPQQNASQTTSSGRSGQSSSSSTKTKLTGVSSVRGSERQSYSVTSQESNNAGNIRYHAGQNSVTYGSLPCSHSKAAAGSYKKTSTGSHERRSIYADFPIDDCSRTTMNAYDHHVQLSSGSKGKAKPKASSGTKYNDQASKTTLGDSKMLDFSYRNHYAVTHSAALGSVRSKKRVSGAVAGCSGANQGCVVS